MWSSLGQIKHSIEIVDGHLRVVLSSYIAIFSTTKYQNVPCNSGVKSIFFGSVATMHSYFWLCIVAKSFFFFYIHTAFVSLLRVSLNVHHAFTLLLVVVVFWWLNEILFYCNVYIILLC